MNKRIKISFSRKFIDGNSLLIFYKIACWGIIAVIVANSYSVPAESLQSNRVDVQKTALTSSQWLDMYADTAEKIISEPIDSFSMIIYGHYNQWRRSTQKSFVLLEKATGAGYGASPKELDSRISIYALAFPGIAIDTPMVKKELIIEQYLLREIGITPPPIQATTVYSDFLKRSPLKSPPSENDISPILENRILLSMDTVVQMCKELFLIKKEKSEVQWTKFMESWPVEEIAVQADSQLCLATDPVNNECLVSVGEFNSYLAFNRMKRSIRLDTARIRALRELLSDLYLAQQAEQAGIPARKGLIEAQETIVEKNLLSKTYASTRKPIVDEQLLKFTYNKYYDRFFKAKRIKTIGMVGSTDSLYIDSLFRSLQKIETSVSPDKLLKKKTFLNSLPWRVSASEDLPYSIISSVDTMRNQQVRIVKTPFGFFLCRVFADKRQSEVSLAQATGKVTYLINEERVRSKGKPDSIRAMEYYRNRNDLFKTPDTLLCRTWLVPFCDTSAFFTMSKISQRDKITGDTTSFQSIIIGSNHLPVEIAGELLRRFKETNNKTAFIGPLADRCGTWYFSVQKVSTGGKQIPFVSVSANILKELEIQHFPIDSILKTETGLQIKKQKVLAGAYRKHLIDETFAIPDNEIQKLIENKTIRVSYENKRKPDSLLIGLARQMLLHKNMEQKQITITKWIETISINRNHLFSGCSDIVNN